MPSLRHRRAAAPRLFALVSAAVVALCVAGSASAEFPTVRSTPSIVGTPQEGQTLSGRFGQWLYSNGLACTECTITHQWQRCNADGSGCTDIAGATRETYVVAAEDVGKRMRFAEVVFKRDCGEWNYSTGTQECRDITQSSVSALTNVVAPRPITTPQASGQPSVQGTAMEDEVLRATGASWTGPGTITKQFYWQRCNTAGEACSTINGAVGPTYRIPASDVGARLRVVEAATNAGGTSQAVSAVTPVVSELRPTATRQVIAVSKVTLPHRLVLSQIVVRQTGARVTVRVKVSDDRGFRVSGAQVRATPTGLLAGSAAPRISNLQGWATFTYRATGAGSTYLFVDARRGGERAQSGVSTANLFRLRLRG